MSAQLSRYLKDFGEPVAVIPAVEPDDLAVDFGVLLDLPPAEPEIDVDAEKQAAHAAGLAEATAALTQKYEAEAETIAAVHERQVEEIRNQYEVEAAALIATRLESIAAEIAELVSASVAKVLAPVMTEFLVDKAVADLAAELRAAIMEGDAGCVAVSGPTVLFEALKKQLGKKADLLRHHETGDLDLTAELGDAVLVTRVSAWATSLKKVVE
ncbi:hypothetical protein QTL95_10895 [Rhizobium sp. S152]|uniref:hypothetical protein n=1 Tax=Rhizobium sp. S152 TaxID=3055038 RepID=UPI0025A98B27|nr:hypothetical protein [Rhizobium sp. S152]MDM9626406.1 hypothetical protein [Rhizobium sp. S152]